MSKTNYVVRFNYDGFVLPNLKRLYEKAYMLMYNAAVNVINPELEKWNDEYGEINDIDDYNSYISNKQQIVLDSINNKYVDSPVKLYSGDQCQIIGKFKDAITKRETTMSISIH